MPEFIAEHTPANLSDFVRGYFETAEWLLDEEIDRDKVRGWSRAAIREGKSECKDFIRANKADLATYCEESGRGMSSAGLDFWLSRNGHGAGYFDRGSHAVFDRLQDAARIYSSVDTYVSRGWLHFQ